VKQRSYVSSNAVIYKLQNSIFITINTTIQIGGITKDIYINVEDNMFQPLLGHCQMYLNLFIFWILVQIWIHIFVIFYYKIMWLLLSNNLWFVYSLALNRTGIKLIKLNPKPDVKLIKNNLKLIKIKVKRILVLYPVCMGSY
jgi:hypothetical protein